MIFVLFSFAFIALVRANSGEGFLGKVKVYRLSECQNAFFLGKFSCFSPARPSYPRYPLNARASMGLQYSYLGEPPTPFCKMVFRPSIASRCCVHAVNNCCASVASSRVGRSSLTVSASNCMRWPDSGRRSSFLTNSIKLSMNAFQASSLRQSPRWMTNHHLG